MKEIVPKDSYGIFADSNDTARVDSVFVAKVFGREHKTVLKAIENLDCSEEFNRQNFMPTSYKDSQGRNKSGCNDKRRLYISCHGLHWKESRKVQGNVYQAFQ
jgi:Uncharacterized phage-encoded protein